MRTITIVVENGVVVDVLNLPEDMDYVLVDRDEHDEAFEELKNV